MRSTPNVVSRLGLEPRALALKGQANNALFLLISQDVQWILRLLDDLPKTAKNSQEITLFEVAMAASGHTYLHPLLSDHASLSLIGSAFWEDVNMLHMT